MTAVREGAPGVVVNDTVLPFQGPGERLVLAAVLAYGGGAWLQWTHPLTGVRHGLTSAGVQSWLQTSTVLLPVVAIAVTLAVFLAGRAHRIRLTWLVVTSGLGAAVGTALCAPLVVLAFPVHHGHGQLPPTWYVIGDGLQVARVDLPLAAVVVMLALFLRRSRPEPTNAQGATSW